MTLLEKLLVVVQVLPMLLGQLELQYTGHSKIWIVFLVCYSGDTSCYLGANGSSQSAVAMWGCLVSYWLVRAQLCVSTRRKQEEVQQQHTGELQGLMYSISVWKDQVPLLPVSLMWLSIIF